MREATDLSRGPASPASTPLVSIVIPTFNRARDLRRALESVLAQTYPAWEVLVVDSHSTDDTDDVVGSFNDPRITLHKTSVVGIIAASRNVGIRRARGTYIAFLDSDDWWAPDKLAESVAYLERGADLVYHDLFLTSAPLRKWSWRRARTRPLKGSPFADLIANGNAMNNSSVVVRASVLAAIEGLAEDRDLVAVEDYDAWLRLAKVSQRFERIPKVLGYYGKGGASASTNDERTLRNLAALEARYAGAISAEGGLTRLGWLNYTRARTLYRLGRYDAALQSLELIHWKRTRFITYIKSRWILLLAKLAGPTRVRS
jgi:glycosyltransferase involved in cell wall biosynthesis